MRTADFIDTPFDSAQASTAASWPAAERRPTAEPQTDTAALTRQDVETILLYLSKTRDKAEQIRERAPAGSYLDKVLMNTIDGIAQEMAQLRYLLAHPDMPLPVHLTSAATSGRMRPAL